MGDAPSPAGATHPPKSNLPMLYYGLVVIGTAAIVLALYNLLIIRWCAEFTNTRDRQRGRRSHGPASSWRFPQSNIKFISSFEYKRQDAEGGGDSECAVCLSAFEEGEELKQLPKCKHSFHAACIDMWLYSHMDCPLCRSPVEPPPDPVLRPSDEHSREGLMGPGLV